MIKNNIKALNVDEFAFKLMTKKEILTSLDRLTRFKYPPSRKNRVYKEIITKNTITPKISNKVFNEYTNVVIDKLVKIIWDYSVKDLAGYTCDSTNINMLLANEDTKTFNSKSMLREIILSDKATNKSNFDFSPDNIKKALVQNGYKIKTKESYDKIYVEYALNNPININDAIKLIDKKTGIPSNIRHLKSLVSCKKEGNGFPVQLLLLVEGITEEILMPVFAKHNNIDFDENGIQIIGAGGKNQVARLYYDLKEKINVPIIIILDSDAEEIYKNVEEVLNEKDKLFLIPNGEFEDILPVDLIKKSINKFYKMTGLVTKQELSKEEPMTILLYELFKEKGFGDFKKAEFAKLIAENITGQEQCTNELSSLLNLIKNNCSNK